MSKIVEFDGKLIGIDKQYKLIDSPKNIKKTSKHYKELLEKVGEGDDSVAAFADYAPAMADVIGEGVSDLLDLTKKEKDNLDNCSFDDQYNFFNECLKEFIGIALPSHDEELEEKKEDPKSPEEEQSGN